MNEKSEVLENLKIILEKRKSLNPPNTAPLFDFMKDMLMKCIRSLKKTDRESDFSKASEALTQELDIEKFIANMRVIKFFMKHIVSPRELKIIKIKSQRKQLKDSEEDFSSGFESQNYIPFIDRLKRDQKPLTNREKKLLLGVQSQNTYSFT